MFGAAAACTLLALGGAHVARAPAAATHGCSARFFAGTKLLGPAALATTGTVGDELAGYRRTGSLTPRAFLARYHDASGWVYPPHGGYVAGPGGEVEEARLDLYPGQDVDRYGSEYGTFLAPAGLPYAARSIPPQNLDGEPAAGCNYHEYRVERELAVEAGPIAPWFAQPGGGIQLQIVATLIQDAPSTANVAWLVANGYLRRIR